MTAMPALSAPPARNLHPPLHRQRPPLAAQALPAIPVVAALLLLGLGACMAWRLKTAVHRAVRLCAGDRRFEASPTPASARVLLVGDSTAVGTGASSPQASIAGLVARRHPQVAIVNRACNGARLADISGQLQQSGRQRYDLILLLAGGNDVIRLTGAAALHRALRHACAHAHTVVLMPAGNVGNCGFFAPPFSWLMTRRSRQLHALVREAAAAHGAVYVNGFAEKSHDPFVLQAQHLNASDGLHPSDAGYQLWFEALQQQAGLSRLLDACEKRHPQAVLKAA